MAYQPTNPHPYVETIDATVANQFSCLVDDRSVLSGATINIWGNGSGMYKLGTFTVSSETMVGSRIRLNVDFTSGLFSNEELENRIKNHENLYIKNNSKYILVTEVESADSYDATLWVKDASLTSRVSYSLYTDLVACIGVQDIDENNLFYGGFTNNSYLSAVVSPEFLKNNHDYAWSVDLHSDDYQYVSEGYTTQDSVNNQMLYLEYTTTIDNILNNPNRYFFIKLDDGIYRKIQRVQSTVNSFIYVNEITPAFYTPPTSGIHYTIYEVPEDAISQHVFRTPKYYFKTRTTPVVTLADIPDTINNGAYTFSATYEQDERTPFSTYQFDLYQDDKLIDSSGQQSSRLISYTFESFINQGNYRIVLTFINDDGVEITREKSFKIDYTLVNSTIAPVIESDNVNTCIKIDYSNHAEIPGKVSKEGAVSFIDDGIHLAQNETVLWDERSDKPLDIPSSSTQAIRWHGDHGFQGKIVEVCDSTYPWLSTSVEFDGEKFIAKVDGDVVSELGLYTNTKNAQIKQDTYGNYQNCTYDGGTQIKILNSQLSTSGLPQVGMWIQTINGEHRKIISYELNADSSLTLFIDRPLLKKLEGCFATYFENSLYRIEDTCELSDTDILIDNDCVSKYWWLIIINPEGSENRVEIRKSALYTESEV